MIILDTNVISEVMRSPSSGPATDWVENQVAEALAITAITVAEILYGIRLLPPGKRQAGLDSVFRAFLDRGFGDRIMVFDQAAAEVYPNVMITRRRAGLPIAPLDAMIASIALSRGADIATRDTAGFRGCGIRVINPWAERAR
jgi:predicted nucleic acid-binding protein